MGAKLPYFDIEQHKNSFANSDLKLFFKHSNEHYLVNKLCQKSMFFISLLKGHSYENVSEIIAFNDRLDPN
jgi:hypothetical protein